MSAGIAAARPAAVLTRASEMPGATAAIDVDPVWPMARKDCMMPQTVPKRPMKGHAEAVVARKVMCRVRRETSTPIALSKARSTPEMFLISSFPADWTAGGCMAIVVTGDSSGRTALIWASSSAYPALKRVVNGVSVSWPAIVLTSEKFVLFLRKSKRFSEVNTIAGQTYVFCENDDPRDERKEQ